MSDGRKAGGNTTIISTSHIILTHNLFHMSRNHIKNLDIQFRLLMVVDDFP